MLDPIRAAIVAKINTVPNIGQVHGYQRFAAREKDLANLYVLDGQLRGWFVRRLSVLEKTEGNATNSEQTHWLIRGYMALDDNNASELAFDELLDALRDAFRIDESFGVEIMDGVVESLTTKDQAGLYIEDTAPVMFAGVLCHSARCVLITRCWR